MNRKIFFTITFFLSQQLFTQSPVNGVDILSRMHEMYKGKWYSTVSFTQKTIQYLSDGSRKEETWFEASKLPGTLRIEIEPIDSGNGMIFVNDSLFIVHRGSLKAARAFIHPLMVLGFDVYTQPVNITVEKLKALSFDLNSCHESVWQEKKVFVIGALSGDTTSNQFWIEQERLLFVRSLMKGKNNPDHINETQFNHYRRLGDGWIETEVLFFTNGKRSAEEYYTDIQHNQPLDDSLFDPTAWNTVSIRPKKK